MLSILRKSKLADKQIRLLFVGLDNAGKSSVLERLMDKDASAEDVRSRVGPTVGFEIRTVDWTGVSVNVWDVGGQKTLRAYWQNYFEKTDTVVWVVDGTDLARMDDCRAELAGLLEEDRLIGASLIVLVNKADVPGCLSSDQVKTALGLDQLAATRNRAILECSAMTGHNLPKAMDWVVQDAKDRLFIF